MDKNLLALIGDLMENQHAISDNPSHGYHGTIDPETHIKPGKDGKKPEGSDHNAKLYAKMHKRVREITGEHPKVAKHYLDSVHGRHLADVHNDNAKKKLTDNHITDYIKKDFAKFKKHYKPDLFEAELLDTGAEEVQIDEAKDSHTYTSSNYDKSNDHPSKSKTTFIKGVHGDEAEHIDNIKHSAKNNGGKAISHEKAKEVAHSPEYHAHAYNYRHDLSRGGSNGYDNGVKKLAGTHPHYQKEEVEELEELSKGALKNYIDKAREDVENKHKEGQEDEKKGWYVASAASHYKARQRSQQVGLAKRKLGEEEEIEEIFHDSGSQFKVGDKVIVKNPSSPMHNKRGTYAGTERGRHVVKHGEGARSFHGDGALLKESRSSWLKALVKEEMKSADKKPETVRAANGKLVTRMVTRKQDVADSGGKDGSNETENK